MAPRYLAASISPAVVMLQAAVDLSYFVLAKGGLMLAFVHPSASPVWIILATGWTELPENPPPDFLRLSKPYRQADFTIALGRVLEAECSA